jgi:DNA-directed RNA polymerase subunit alpha
MTEATLALLRTKLEESLKVPTMRAFCELREFYYHYPQNKQFVKELLQEWEKKEKADLALAYAHFLLLDYPQAELYLKKSSESEVTTFLLGEVYWNLEQFQQSLQTFSTFLEKNPQTDLELQWLTHLVEVDETEAFAVLKKSYSSFEKALEKVVHLDEDNTKEDTKKVLKVAQEQTISSEHASKILYLLGRKMEREGHYSIADAYYKASTELDPRNSYALFRLAYHTALRGEEFQALKYYQSCVKIQPTSVHALLNLGILYEDFWKFDDALKCFETVLKEFPNHRRAKLYLTDCLSSKSMCFDEDSERRSDRSLQILKTPVADFELSVRSRNCLEKMNIISLGDLVKKSEAELLSYKNFGETSLTEIKQVLTRLGLKLGQTEPITIETPKKKSLKKLQSAEDEAILNKTISEIDFSVRARKAMSRLKIVTLRDLTSRSEADLMTIKNFGQTSLTNVKQKLAQFGLKLSDSRL